MSKQSEYIPIAHLEVLDAWTSLQSSQYWHSHLQHSLEVKEQVKDALTLVDIGQWLTQLMEDIRPRFSNDPEMDHHHRPG